MFPTATPALRFNRIEIGTHPQEILENNVDTAHLYPLHGFPDGAVLEGPASDGHIYTISLRLSRTVPRSERSAATPAPSSTVWA
ncbi:hypothetical protein [Streptomyces sp. NPDC059076]|uniref:hypothetical protein n=1 Tax=unclassified Streptomyces TaxID=2593676 RepID=UPI003687B447